MEVRSRVCARHCRQLPISRHQILCHEDNENGLHTIEAKSFGYIVDDNIGDAVWHPRRRDWCCFVIRHQNTISIVHLLNTYGRLSPIRVESAALIILSESEAGASISPLRWHYTLLSAKPVFEYKQCVICQKVLCCRLESHLLRNDVD